MAEQYNSAYTGPEIDAAIAKARSIPLHAFTPDAAASYAGTLLYIAADGRITPLQLGKGLEIVDGVLNVTVSAAVATLEVDADGNATITGAEFTVDDEGNATIAGSTFTIDAEGNATI